MSVTFQQLKDALQACLSAVEKLASLADDVSGLSDEEVEELDLAADVVLTTLDSIDYGCVEDEVDESEPASD